MRRRTCKTVKGVLGNMLKFYEKSERWVRGFAYKLTDCDINQCSATNFESFMCKLNQENRKLDSKNCAMCLTGCAYFFSDDDDVYSKTVEKLNDIINQSKSKFDRYEDSPEDNVVSYNDFETRRHRDVVNVIRKTLENLS